MSTQESTRGKIGEMTMKANKTSGVCLCICLCYCEMSRKANKVNTNSLRKPSFTEILFPRIKECRENDLIDSKYGFDRITLGEKTAYLINMHACEVGLEMPAEQILSHCVSD